MFWKEENVNFKKRNMLYWFIPKSIIICMTEMKTFLYMLRKMPEVYRVFFSFKKIEWIYFIYFIYSYQRYKFINAVIKFVLTLTYFIFNGIIYKLLAPMSSPLSFNISDIVMEDLEEKKILVIKIIVVKFFTVSGFCLL